MKEINLPAFTPLLKTNGQKKYIFDSFRKKFVTLTPEEWVRQHWAHFLVNYKKVPKGLIGIEVALTFNKMKKRADIVVFDKNQIPALIVECKAANVNINEHTCIQIANYNAVFNAKYLIVSNGLTHYLFEVDYIENRTKMLTEFPDFKNW